MNIEVEAFFAGNEWINAGGFALIMIGVTLLITELFLPSFGVFGFAGAASILIGTVQLHQTGAIEEMPVSPMTLVTLAVVGAILAFLGGVYSYFNNQKKNTTGSEAMLGKDAKIIQWSGKSGRILVEGEDWKAYSDNKVSLKKNDIVTIEQITGLKIKIKTK